MFDPLLAAELHRRQGARDEAFWLVFLFVHFGKHRVGGWRYVRDVYGKLNGRDHWSWESTSRAPSDFRNWLAEHAEGIKRAGPGGFGNHRKYQSLDACKPQGTGAAVESYVLWVSPPRTHDRLVSTVLAEAKGDAAKGFDLLYESMSEVTSFGRTARFDYLCMLGKLGLAPIEPGSTYMVGSTGPYQGALLLFGQGRRGGMTRAEADGKLVALGARLGVGMQVIEDALCNWQKSPDVYVAFRG